MIVKTKAYSLIQRHWGGRRADIATFLDFSYPLIFVWQIHQEIQ